MHDTLKVTIRKAIRPLTVLFCLWLAPSWTWAVQTEVRIGVLAKRGYEKSLERWNATAEYLNETLPAYHFNIIPMAFDDIQVVVKNRMVDFVIVNPGIYADLSVKYGVRRILTLVNELSGNSRISQFGSVIFTLNSNSDIQQLADLKNQRVAAVHHTSLGGWIMALRELHTTGLETWDLGSLLFLNTHDAVVKAVLNREAEVGIVRTDTLERIAQEGNLNLHNLRVIAPRQYDHFPYAISTPLYPEWPFSQLPNTSQTLARDVSIALLKLPADHPAARDARIHGWTIPENYQTVHDLLMLLEMPPYEKKLPEKFIDSLVRAWHWYLAATLILLFLIFLGLRVIRLNRSLTESKKTLEDSIEAQIATFEQAAVGLAHVTLTGRFLRMNRKLSELTALSRQQMEATNLKDMLHRDDLPLCISAFDQLREDNKSSVSTQLRILCGNRENKWIQLSLSKKPNGNSHETYLVAVIDDIDKYKKLEEESRRVQQQKELILDIAGDGILGLDDQANHVFVNPAAAEMLGYSIDEMLQKNSHVLWHHSREDGSEYPESECPITNVLRLGKIHRGAKETVWRKDGTPLQIEFISTPIKEADRITGAVVVFHQTVSDTKDDATSPPES
ncbi:MAG: PhnD/SsuA/transferrin family substrate-binding protein [Candidatus Thiodiazotropha sp. (ex Dulcina madagascariensis)]|nr:PhnD/SsuA/transferrin family substrate-binding protein [Candidatus Thiodiazotropha sp. (ex Dulcina madagascariensis)]